MQEPAKQEKGKHLFSVSQKGERRLIAGRLRWEGKLSHQDGAALNRSPGECCSLDWLNRSSDTAQEEVILLCVIGVD